MSSPLNIKIFSRGQLIICDHSLDPTVYLDATGTVVRPQIPTRKKFYYCGVVVTKELHKLCPILEMVSCEHDSDYL